MDAWATVADVNDLTGRTVEEDDVAVAQAVVEIAANRDYADTSKLKSRDVTLLRKAVAFQAAYLANDPDVIVDPHLASEQAGSMTRVQTRDDPASIPVAPLTRMVLRRLSWKGMQTIPVAPRRHMAVVRELPDDVWEPL